MSKSFEISGTIHTIMDEETRTNFRSREFVLNDNDPKYPQLIKFQAVQERCDILGTLTPGDNVTVSFDLRGREYGGKYYTTANAWKIVKDGAAQTKLPSAFPEPQVLTSGNPDDLPF